MEILKSIYKISDITIRSHFCFSSIKVLLIVKLRVFFQKPLTFEKKIGMLGSNFGTEVETYNMYIICFVLFGFCIIFIFYIMHIVFIVFMFHKHFKFLLNSDINIVSNFQTCRERQME